MKDMLGAKQIVTMTEAKVTNRDWFESINIELDQFGGGCKVSCELRLPKVPQSAASLAEMIAEAYIKSLGVDTDITIEEIVKKQFPEQFI